MGRLGASLTGEPELEIGKPNVVAPVCRRRLRRNARAAGPITFLIRARYKNF